MITALGLPWILCPQNYVDNGGGFANKSWQALFSNTALIKPTDASNTCLNRNLKISSTSSHQREGEDFLTITKARTWNRKYFRLSKREKKKTAAEHGENWERWQPDGLKPIWPIQLQCCSRAAMSPDKGWETWCLHTVTKQDYLTPAVEGTEDRTDSHCQAWLQQLLSKKGTQSPACSPFQRSVLP